MNVGAILAQKGRKVITISSDIILQDVSRILAENRIGSIVVLDENEAVKGIISERDIVRVLAEKGPKVLQEPVTFCMTEEVVTCGESDSVEQVMAAMSSGRFRHMPVVENGKLLGIISIGDVVKTKIEVAEKDAEHLRQYIVSSR